jgi:cobalt-zinc-cadmium efflux system outer membrane protein
MARLKRSPLLVLIAVLFAAPSAWVMACPLLSDDSASSLSVGDVLARVAPCHPDVRAAERALAGASADMLTAAQRPNPQLTLGAANLSRDLRSGHLWDKTFDHLLRIDQFLERGDKPALRVVVADATRAAARADLAEALRQARLTTLRSQHDLCAALARRAELQSTATLRDESRRALERRMGVGDAAPLDAVRFQLDALRLHADLSQADADTRTLRLQLATLIGAEAKAQRLTPSMLEPATLAALNPPQPLDRRPDVVAAQVRALKTRDVGVGVQLDRYPISNTNSSGTGNTLSVFVSVPLFVRHTFEGENARVEADANSAEEVLRCVRAVRSRTCRGAVAGGPGTAPTHRRRPPAGRRAGGRRRGVGLSPSWTQPDRASTPPPCHEPAMMLRTPLFSRYHWWLRCVPAASLRPQRRRRRHRYRVRRSRSPVPRILRACAWSRSAATATRR